MALLGATFQIGRSALAAYEAAISIAGQNIANVGNSNYTRQSGRLSAIPGGYQGRITPGGGVQLAQLQRHIDEALENRLRLSLGERTLAETRYSVLSQVEASYHELTDTDLSTQMTEFFGHFGTLETSPQDMSTRNYIRTAATQLTDALQRQRATLVRQLNDLNQTAQSAVTRANEITAEIADLNKQIATQEAGGQRSASALRDRRDGLLRDLSALLNIRVQEQDSGAVNVYAGSEPLVEFNRARELLVEPESVGGVEYAAIRFADNNGRVIIQGGQLGAVLEARDGEVLQQIERLDQLARGLIYEVNRVQSTGRGLVGLTQARSAYAVTASDAALNSSDAGLPFPVENGTFIVHVRDRSTGQEITRQIEVDLDGLNGDDTTLADLAAALDGVPGLNASVTVDNRMSISAESGNEFWFSDDRSGALAALGVNNFFEGTSAADISVAAEILGDSRLIAASSSGAEGDGTNAGRLASVIENASTLLGEQSVSDYHADTINQLAVATAGALTSYEASDAVYSSLLAQRESLSGVNLDEEALNLANFEAAYQGAARYLSVVDALTTEVLALIPPG